MTKIAVFPGSFDPITLGHTDLIERSSLLFDKIYVAIGHNTSKNYLLTLDQRIKTVTESCADIKNCEVVYYEGLTVKLCLELGAKYIVRGLRSGTDFDYERSIALMNATMEPEVETLFFISRAELGGINSSIVREIWKSHGEIERFVPKAVLDELNK